LKDNQRSAYPSKKDLAMKKQPLGTALNSDRWSYLWLAIATFLLVFTYGMYRNPLAACLAPIFLIRFLRGQKAGRGFLLIFLALAIANTISWWNTTHVNTAVFRVIFGILVGFLYSIPFLLDRVLVRKFQGFAATLVFPFAASAFEFLIFWPSPVTTYGSLAYSLSSSPFITQLASISGLWGVTFLICWFASTVNWIWEEEAVWQRIRRGLVIFAGVMLVVLLFGMVRLTAFQPQPGTVRIHGIIETDYTVEEWYRDVAPLIATDPAAVKASYKPINDRYLSATIREARSGAQIVVWPELAAVGYQEDFDAFIEQARSVASQEGIYLAMGVGLLSADAGVDYIAENRLILIDPQGQIAWNYLKYGCVPAMRMYTTQVPTLDTPYGRLAGVICCDLDFPYVIRQVSQKGVDILLVPGFEPSPENFLAHSQMVTFRAIENGVSIFRPTTQGLSLAIDPYGRTLGSMDDRRANERVFVVQLPNQRVFTVYSVVGDLFGWLMLAGFVLLVILAIVQGSKRSSASGTP
jgi:apolipoprotein N-acyltransferase